MTLGIELFDALVAFVVAIIGIALCAGVIALAAMAIAGFYFGRNTLSDRGALIAARRERRLLREMKLWQEKVLLLRGAGPLERQPETQQPTGSPKKFVTPSEVIADLREKQSTAPQAPKLTEVPKRQPVPASIQEPFLRETGAAVSANTN